MGSTEVAYSLLVLKEVLRAVHHLENITSIIQFFVKSFPSTYETVAYHYVEMFYLQHTAPIGTSMEFILIKVFKIKRCRWHRSKKRRGKSRNTFQIVSLQAGAVLQAIVCKPLQETFRLKSGVQVL